MKRLYTVILIILTLAMFIGCDLIQQNLGDGEVEVGLENLLYLRLSHIIDESDTPVSEIEFMFQEPSEIKATGYYLEYADHIGDNPVWTKYQVGEENLLIESTIYGQDIEIRPVENQHYFYRLLVVGGEYDGMGSNIVRAETSYSTLHFSNYGIDESVFPPEIIAPNVGYKMIANFSISSISNTPAESIDLIYQWYRMNPANFSEFSQIESATGNLSIQAEEYGEQIEIEYTTVPADQGYILFLEVIEDTDVGGSLLRIPGTWIVQ